MKFTHSYLFIVAIIVLLAMPASRLAAHDVLARQNIDDLTSDQVQTLTAAMHALVNNQPEKYLALQQRHDGGGGFPGCFHGGEQFLPWHRQLMRDFEVALQNTGVSGAESISMPYWDWSQSFKGNRYPAVAEDPTSPFFDKFQLRNTNTNGGPLPRPSLALALKETDWASFGGEPNFKGAIENPPHDLMHGDYIGGFLTSPSSAARDPLFWLFHAGIDYFWWKWQQIPGNEGAQPAQPDTPLRGWPNITIKDTWDTNKMGYTYKHKRTMLDAGMMATPSFRAAARTKNVEMPDYSFDIEIPAAGFKKAVLEIADVKASGANTYLSDYYLYPSDVTFAKDDKAFLDKYRAAKGANFGDAEGTSEHTHHNATAGIRVNITEALQRAAEEHSGETWKITIVYRGVMNPHTKEVMPVMMGRDVNNGTVHLILD